MAGPTMLEKVSPPHPPITDMRSLYLPPRTQFSKLFQDLQKTWLSQGLDYPGFEFRQPLGSVTY
jgi:hypothetical protein